MHVDAQLRILTKKLESEFGERVRLAVLERNKPHLDALKELEDKARKQHELYETLNNKFKPLFTEEEYRIILICLHPDNSATKERRETAFKAVQAVKLQLTGKK